jgi:CRP-like cAMP-binding protein
LPRTVVPVNRLLERLPSRDRAQFVAACEPVDLAFGQVLDAPGAAIKYVYFPTDSFISLLAFIDSTEALEVALAGNEGVYGLPVAFGIKLSPVQAIVQGAGTALRIEPAAFRTQLAKIPSLRAAVDRYSHVVMSQLMQTAGCNRFHVVEQRLARWLLMTADRAHSLTLRITHEFLAYMLGVRRVGITEAAGALQRDGLISYSRGVVNILDRKGLERAACGCYRNDLNAYARALA